MTFISSDEAFLLRMTSKGQCLGRELGIIKKIAEKCRETFYLDSNNCLAHSITRYKVSIRDDNALRVDDIECTKMSYSINGYLESSGKCLQMNVNTLKRAKCKDTAGRFVIQAGMYCSLNYDRLD